MRKPLLLLTVASALLACGKRGDPKAPLPRTPLAVGEFKVAQRGDKIELSLTAPRTTTGGERLPVLGIEFLYAPGGDFVKAAEKIRRPRRASVSRNAAASSGTAIVPEPRSGSPPWRP